MNKPGMNQSIRAEHGSVIENVTQIISSGRPEVLFRSESALIIPNRVNKGEVITIVHEALMNNFWTPPGLDTALDRIEVQRWYTPLWRLRGTVSCDWTQLIEKVVAKIDDEEIKQTERQLKHDNHIVDWIVTAHHPKGDIQRAILKAILTLNRAELPVHVTWEGYPCGRWFEYACPNLKTLFSKKTQLVAGASLLFPETSTLEHSISLPKLNPKLSMQDAVKRSKQQIRDYLYCRESRLGRTIENFTIALDIENIEQSWFPFWVAQYTYKEQQGFVVVNGYKKDVVSAPISRSLWTNLIVWGILTLILGVCFWPFAAFFWYDFMTYHSGILTIFMPLLFTLLPFVAPGILVVTWWIKHSLSL